MNNTPWVAKIGLWVMDNMVAPWEIRREKRKGGFLSQLHF
jgi:hypothetical protein